MASEGNGFTHYLVSKEVVLGEACVIEKCNEWISLAFIKLGIDRPEAVIDRAFVENHALVSQNRELTPSDSPPTSSKTHQLNPSTSAR